MRLVYLDHNATTPPHPDVLLAMGVAAAEAWANPASVHRAGRAARRVLDDARDAVAALAGENARDVVFTSGGTEANNLGVYRPFLARAAGRLVTSRLEHPSVIACAEELARRGVDVRWLPVPRSGALEPAAVASAFDELPRGAPALLVTHAVHHETGVIQPVAELVAAASASGAETHVDAVQAAGRVAHALWRGAHSTAIASHKMRGPKGIGALVTRAGIAVRPILLGGSQERGLRPGTVDAVAAAGFGSAARRAIGGPARYEALAPLRDEAESRLAAAAASYGAGVDVTVCGRRAPHVSHMLVQGWRGDELAAALDLEGVCVSSGSACAAGTAEPSPAIVALVGRERAASALRVSFGEPSSREDLEALVTAFSRVLARGCGASTHG